MKDEIKYKKFKSFILGVSQEEQVCKFLENEKIKLVGITAKASYFGTDETVIYYKET